MQSQFRAVEARDRSSIEVYLIFKIFKFNF